VKYWENLDRKHKTLVYAAATIGGLLLLALLVRSPAPPPQPKPFLMPRHPKLNEPTISVYVVSSGRTVWLKLEDYITGVVAGEVVNTWPAEALKAQAVVARTFIMQKLLAKARSRYGTHASTDTTEYQAYRPAAVNAAVRAAVRSTRGMILTYNAKPIYAFFHSCSGGMTATALEGLNFKQGPTPYLRPVADGPCSAPNDKWRASFSAYEVGRAAGTRACRTISIVSWGPSGRAVMFSVNGKAVMATDLRSRLGPNRMKSTLVTSVALVGRRVRMTGNGWGHGVGMSQWGAHDRALAGSTYEQIVRLYYPGTQLEKIWD
jgi:stage II sporulation protein D